MYLLNFHNVKITQFIWLFSYLQAFVDFFSRGLEAEYKSKGIIIQVSDNFLTVV